MTLQTSGRIDVSDINVELGRSSNATGSLNSADFRDLADRPTGSIALSNFYGKSYVEPPITSYLTYSKTSTSGAGQPISITITVTRSKAASISAVYSGSFTHSLSSGTLLDITIPAGSTSGSRVVYSTTTTAYIADLTMTYTTSASNHTNPPTISLPDGWY